MYVSALFSLNYHGNILKPILGYVLRIFFITKRLSLFKVIFRELFHLITYLLYFIERVSC